MFYSQNKCNPNVFISGSWDTTAVIWDINQQIALNTLQGHAYAVTVLALPNQNFVTGSQEKNLNFGINMEIKLRVYQMLIVILFEV